MVPSKLLNIYQYFECILACIFPGFPGLELAIHQALYFYAFENCHETYQIADNKAKVTTYTYIHVGLNYITSLTNTQ